MNIHDLSSPSDAELGLTEKLLYFVSLHNKEQLLLGVIVTDLPRCFCTLIVAVLLNSLYQRDSTQTYGRCSCFAKMAARDCDVTSLGMSYNYLTWESCQISTRKKQLKSLMGASGIWLAYVVPDMLHIIVNSRFIH